MRLQAKSGEEVWSTGRESSTAERGAVKGMRDRAVEDASVRDVWDVWE